MATKHLGAHSKATRSSGNHLPGFAEVRPTRQRTCGFHWARAGLLSRLGAAESCELHRFPPWSAGDRIPHILLGMGDLSVSRWMPRSMDDPPDNKDLCFCPRHPRHFPEVAVWLRAVACQSNVFLICSRTLRGAIKVSPQQTCYYTAWKLN